MIKGFDRKSEYFPLALQYGMLYIHWRDFFINFMQPPCPELHYQWPNLLAELMGNFFDILVATRGHLADKMLWQYERHQSLETGIYPTFRDLYYLILNTRYPVQSNERRHQETALNRLRGLFAVFGENICSRRQMDWQRFLNVDWFISLDGIPTDYQNFFISVIVAMVVNYRIRDGERSGSLQDLIVSDEASTILKRAYENTTGTYLLTDYMARSREFGIGFLVASQSLSNLAQSVLANTAIKVLVGGAGLGEDYATFAPATGLTPEQREFLKRRTMPGQACGKDPRYPYPFTFEVPRVVE